MSFVTQKISLEGYGALSDALAVVTWYKRAFKQLLRTGLRRCPELFARLDFDDTKRNVAEDLVHLLEDGESQYSDVTLTLMQDIASKEHFPDIEGLDEPDRTLRLSDAKRAVVRLKEVTDAHAEAIREAERLRTQIEEREEHAASRRARTEQLTALKDRFIELQTVPDTPQARGYAFEKLLTDLFDVYDLEPHLAYVNGTEQIDGSFRLDTDDYIVEAKWRAQASSRADADIFATKVTRKGRNVQGLFVSVQGFTDDFITRYQEASPFITVDGADLYLILDDRYPLPDALAAKRRHLSDTGSCHYSLQAALNR